MVKRFFQKYILKILSSSFNNNGAQISKTRSKWKKTKTSKTRTVIHEGKKREKSVSKTWLAKERQKSDLEKCQII